MNYKKCVEFSVVKEGRRTKKKIESYLSIIYYFLIFSSHPFIASFIHNNDFLYKFLELNFLVLWTVLSLLLCSFHFISCVYYYHLEYRLVRGALYDGWDAFLQSAMSNQLNMNFI